MIVAAAGAGASFASIPNQRLTSPKISGRDSPTANGDHGIWAITSYFNPAGYRSRLRNYRIFRRRLAVPLATVELSCSPDFELGEGDADVLVQIRGRHVLWQKERLLNVALRALPADCQEVAWIDCDVVLGRPDWPRVATRLLRDVPLVQLFHERYNLPLETLPEQASSLADYAVGNSLAYKLSHGLVSTDVVREGAIVRRWGSSLGLAWAAQRRLLEIHGLYDAGILGGGDRAMACATFAQFDGLRNTWHANQRQSEHFSAWARPFHEEVQGNVGCVEGAVFHLWHGHRRDRMYHERYKGLRQFAFDPFRDIAIDSSGCWRWNTRKMEMHRYVRDYFWARTEDG